VARLTAREKLRRDAEVVSDRARGYGWASIAEHHDLSERHCRQIWREHWDAEPAMDEIDPVEIAREAIAQLDAIVEDLARIADAARHDAVRLGALKAKRDAITQRLILLQTIGLLPCDLGMLRHEIDVRQVTKAFIAVLDRHNLADEVEDDLLSALRDGSIRRDADVSSSINGDGGS